MAQQVKDAEGTELGGHCSPGPCPWPCPPRATVRQGWPTCRVGGCLLLLPETARSFSSCPKPSHPSQTASKSVPWSGSLYEHPLGIYAQDAAVGSFVLQLGQGPDLLSSIRLFICCLIDWFISSFIHSFFNNYVQNIVKEADRRQLPGVLA